LHDNAPAHRALSTQKKLAYLGFLCLDRRLYFPKLASSDYHLFPGLKKKLKSRNFSFDTEVIAASQYGLRTYQHPLVVLNIIHSPEVLL
jgi:hypothetical protein